MSRRSGILCWELLFCCIFLPKLAELQIRTGRELAELLPPPPAFLRAAAGDAAPGSAASETEFSIPAPAVDPLRVMPVPAESALRRVPPERSGLSLHQSIHRQIMVRAGPA